MANIFDALGKLDGRLRQSSAALDDYIFKLKRNAEQGDDLSKLVLGFINDVETGARRADEAVLAFGDMKTELTGTTRNLGQLLSELLKNVEQTSQRTRESVTDSEQALERLRGMKDLVAKDLVEMTELYKQGKLSADFYLGQLQEVQRTFHGALGQLAGELADAARQAGRGGYGGGGAKSPQPSIGPQSGGIVGGSKGGGGGSLGAGGGSGGSGGITGSGSSWDQNLVQASQHPSVWDENLIAASQKASAQYKDWVDQSGIANIPPDSMAAAAASKSARADAENASAAVDLLAKKIKRLLGDVASVEGMFVKDGDYRLLDDARREGYFS